MNINKGRNKVSEEDLDLIFVEEPNTPTARSKKEKGLVVAKDYTFNEIEWGVNIDESVIYLHGDIQMGNLFDLISKFRIVLKNRPKKCAKHPITLFINSNGGDVYEAMGIVDYFDYIDRVHGVKVNVCARGRAMSAGATILICATGTRSASKNTTIMLHQASGELYGKAADIKANADHIEGIEEDFYTLMASKTKQPRDYWEKACRKDFYVRADKAVELGIIDEIV